MRRRVFLAGVGAGVAGLAGCGAAETADSDIGMSASAFRPSELEVDAGDTVVWANTSARPHTVTAYGDGIPPGAAYFATGGFDSETAARDAWWNGMDGAIEAEETYEHTFEVAGTYEYFCVPHEDGGMTGRIVVR